MFVLEQSFKVSYQYQVYFTEHLFDAENALLAQVFRSLVEPGYVARALFVVDEGVWTAHPVLGEQISRYFDTLKDLVVLAPEIIRVPGGEAVKNDRLQVERIVDAVNEYGIDRHSYLVAIGGGAVLDMAGYAAAISHRGVRHIRIPTTVLSQNDSGIGVKNSVNYKGKKNFLGTFVPPVAVINDSAFLQTLEDRDWRSGISEAVKVALIKDIAFFEWLDNQKDALANRAAEPMAHLIIKCADLHLQHIRGGDPFEFGSARPLDFGHWAAHKLEYLTNFELRHGEAVAIGIALDTVYSFLKGFISETDVLRVLNLFTVLGFGLSHEKLWEDDSRHLKAGLAEFREHLGGRLTITLLEALGKGIEVHEMDENLIEKAANYLKTYETSLRLSPSV
ncbi:3-dehydroquinate synthase [Ravibacter arvi]|uniref:3-dehydroquinate synthase n=1 Tax=Ravibacter arvi TaxID=2051041 RepID=A0ABP8LZ45_9BACT